MSVCIGNINRGSLSITHVDGLVHSLSTQAVQATKYVTGGPYLDANRNQCVAAFLTETDCDWLLFVDSDIGFDGTQVSTLLDGVDGYVTPVVGGLYMNPVAGGVKPVAYREGSQTITDWDGAEVTQVWHNPIEWLPDCGVIDVDAVGTGFMGIHRNLLEKMPHHYPAPQHWFACEVHDNALLGEDLAFCRRVRDMGYPIKLDTRVRVAHSKEILLTPDNFKERD